MQPPCVVHIIFAERLLRSAEILDLHFGEEILFSPRMVAGERLPKSPQN